jgi:ribosomal protein S18 acetylase RimI-like enzyme
VTRIERATTYPQVEAAERLFDGPLDREATDRFLADPGHHLLLAYDGLRPVGMVTGVELTHPDKGTEMFLYELGVDEGSRGRGLGTALVEALAAVALRRGCYGMWVLTDDDNAAAVGAYRAAGGSRPSDCLLLEWTFRAG